MVSDPLLSASLAALAPPGVIVDHRLIRSGDEHALFAEEVDAFRNSAVRVRRASGAARIVARGLLERMGRKGVALPKSPAGPPIWPSGIVGSLAHSSMVAVAAIGTADCVSGLGIDVEPAEALPADLLDLVTTSRERATINSDPFGGRLFFVAKEAVYKAVFPQDRCFLEHREVEIDLTNSKAVLRGERVVEIRYAISTHLVALAFF